MAEIAAAQEDGEHIALHCRQGVGRAATMAAEQRQWIRRLPVRQSAGLARQGNGLLTSAAIGRRTFL